MITIKKLNFLTLSFSFLFILFFFPQRFVFGKEKKGRNYSSQAPNVGRNGIKDFFKQALTAGHFNDFYFNMDGGHSKLNVKNYPNLGVLLSGNLLSTGEIYSKNKHVIIGNASLGTTNDSRGKMVRGSLINNYYTGFARQSVETLYNHYRDNVVYVYPGVRCFDVGVNGRLGFGDYFPANTPYTLGSYGASGTDKPFLRAWVSTLASFQPLVKERLKGEGLLMPTMQMVFRQSNQNISHPDDYLTGKAHPPVFFGSNIDVFGMMRLANFVTLDTIPPMIQLEVLYEDKPINGVDFYESRFTSETIFNTPCSIARAFRGKEFSRKMTISAEFSYDVNNRPLEFHWVLLRGNPDHVKIIPKNKEESIIDLHIDYFEKYKDPDYNFFTNRVDIGAFAYNGVFFSAPAFVTSVSFPSEARTYNAEGRIIEIGYNVGDTEIGISLEKIDFKNLFSSTYDIHNWDALFQLVLGGNKTNLGVAQIVSQLTQEEIFEIETCWRDLKECRKRIREPPADDPKQKKQIVRDAKNEAVELMTKVREPLNCSVKQILEQALNKCLKNIFLYPENHFYFDTLFYRLKDTKRKSQFMKQKKKLIALGILQKKKNVGFEIKSIREGEIGKNLTSYERNQLEWLNIAIFNCLLYPQFMNKKFIKNSTDVRLYHPKSWYRDVYHYDEKAHFTGWTRYKKDGIEEYTKTGHLVTGEKIKYVTNKTKKKSLWHEVEVIPTKIN